VAAVEEEQEGGEPEHGEQQQRKDDHGGEGAEEGDEGQARCDVGSESRGGGEAGGGDHSQGVSHGAAEAERERKRGLGLPETRVVRGDDADVVGGEGGGEEEREYVQRCGAQWVAG